MKIKTQVENEKFIAKNLFHHHAHAHIYIHDLHSHSTFQDFSTKKKFAVDGSWMMLASFRTKLTLTLCCQSSSMTSKMSSLSMGVKCLQNSQQLTHSFLFAPLTSNYEGYRHASSCQGYPIMHEKVQINLILWYKLI